MEQSAIAIWSIVASIVSVIIGLLAIAMSVYFFVVSRNTESAVSNSLTKIETQAQMLQQITGNQLDRLTKFVTEHRDLGEEALLATLVKLPNQITASLHQTSSSSTHTQLVNEIVTCYIALYFYIAQTNYWAQHYLPQPNEFDSKNPLHAAVKRIIDASAEDFEKIKELLSHIDKSTLNSNPLSHLGSETQDEWGPHVKSSSDVYAD